MDKKKVELYDDHLEHVSGGMNELPTEQVDNVEMNVEIVVDHAVLPNVVNMVPPARSSF